MKLSQLIAIGKVVRRLLHSFATLDINISPTFKENIKFAMLKILDVCSKAIVVPDIVAFINIDDSIIITQTSQNETHLIPYHLIKP